MDIGLSCTVLHGHKEHCVMVRPSIMATRGLKYPHLWNNMITPAIITASGGNDIGIYAIHTHSFGSINQSAAPKRNHAPHITTARFTMVSTPEPYKPKLPKQLLLSQVTPNLETIWVSKIQSIHVHHRNVFPSVVSFPSPLNRP